MSDGVVGGMAVPAVTSAAPPQGGPALRVVRDDTQATYGGPALSVYLVSAAEVASGAFTVQGNVPIPLAIVVDGRAAVGAVAPVPVFVID